MASFMPNSAGLGVFSGHAAHSIGQANVAHTLRSAFASSAPQLYRSPREHRIPHAPRPCPTD